MVLLDPEIVDAMAAHAAGEYPNECCGALVGDIDGDRRRIRAAWPLTNIAHDTRRRFEIDPADYLRVERRAEASGVTLVGFYHSHPDAPAAPSSTDLAAAWPGFSYVILSSGPTQDGAPTCWRVREDRTAFDSEEISWRRES